MDKKNLHLIFVGLCIGTQCIGKLVRATMGSLWRFLKKVKIELPSIWPSHSWVHPEKTIAG